jgi:cytochrome c peroxidase
MSRLWIASVTASLLFPVLAQAGDLRADANAVFKPIDASSVNAVVKNNAITPAKVELGHKLFFDPRLSKSQIISCNSCHNLGTGGVDAGPTSIGHGWAKGPRRAPTVLNAVFNVAQFWDGRAVDLKAQAKGPVQADVEMNNTPAAVEATLKSMPAYVAEFKAAFPNDANAVSFDKFLTGDASAISDVEKKGLRLFIDKGCASCHGGVNVGGDGYHPFGVAEKPDALIMPVADRGRFKVTKDEADAFVFRSAPLRNVALRAPYFHSGAVWTLEDAVDVMAKDQLGVALTPEENGAIVAFLGTLNGEQPKVSYPVLPARTKDTPRPQ